MKREEQDKLWAELSEENKAHYREQYVEQQTMSESGVPNLLEDLFGEHNLKQTQAYEEVAKELFESGYYYYDYIYDRIAENSAACEMPMACTSRKQVEKVCAINRLLNVAKFLNKNEDGSDWVPDWFDLDQNKFTFFMVKDEFKILGRCSSLTSFVYFRTEELANQAVQILGEDVVRMALTTVY